MSKLNIIESIRSCVFDIIEDEYKRYLQSNKLLALNPELLISVIEDYYTNNSKIVKSRIRDVLKNKYKDE